MSHSLSSEERKRFLSGFSHALEIAKLTDEQLADEAIQVIWERFEIEERELAVLCELLDRFSAVAGVEAE